MKNNPSHTSHAKLNSNIKSATTSAIINAKYRHYKFPDRIYKVLLLGIQEASEKVCVVYQDIAHPDAPPFVRDLDSWSETVVWEGKVVKRFTLIESS